MGITEVVRGDDLLPSTARQLLLYAALRLPAPRFAHVPLVLAADGERLAKRSGARSLGELRDDGVAAEAVVGWLAQSCGLAPAGSRCRAEELVDQFSWERLPREAARLEAGQLTGLAG
jgi:glutamyl-tRNA synthetase